MKPETHPTLKLFPPLDLCCCCSLLLVVLVLLLLALLPAFPVVRLLVFTITHSQGAHGGLTHAQLQFSGFLQQVGGGGGGGGVGGGGGGGGGGGFFDI
eukprot:754701-Hanusia_phi.AAC.3